MKPLVDAKGRMIMRDNFLIEGINCEVDTFGAECIEVNRYYGKNNAIKDVKAHHYIISFAPEDNITMQEAMDFGKQYVEKFLPGHQAILAVHPDGHNGTGNVHVHIVINSVRKYEGKKERWQDKPCEYRQGCKHKSTGKFMRAAKCWVMRECMLKGYNQVNLLACSDGNDYWVEKRGKEAEPDFKTDKDMIRERLDALIQHAESLKHMIYYLEHVEDWQIRETNKTISFRMPHMKKSIRGKSLGERYDKDALENRIAEIIALKEEKLRAEQETMREETLEITKEQAFVAIPVEATAAEELEKIVEVEEPAAEMFEAILEDEYLVAGESKLVYETSTSSEPDYTEELAELQSRFICLQYEFQYNLDKISDLDYEHRYRDPEYITYQSNLLRIVDKSLYINQWTEELAKCGLFQKDLKMMPATQDGFTIFVEKSPAAVAVAESEMIPEELSYKIISYNHHSMHGNIIEKKNVILQLADLLEAKRENLSKIDKEYSSDLFYAFNKFNLRHNNIDPNLSSKYVPVIAQMKNDELESWYDEVYQMCLLAFLRLEHDDRKIEFDKLKSRIEQK